MAKRPTKKIASTDDKRVENNPPQTIAAPVVGPDPMRLRYRVLTDGEKISMACVKNDLDAVWRYLDRMGQSRELSIAKTHLEEACMWAVKHITGDKA